MKTTNAILRTIKTAIFAGVMARGFLKAQARKRATSALTIIALMPFISLPAAAQDVTDDLVARWHMDASSGNIPDSVGGHTGTVAGGWNYLTGGGIIGGSLQSNAGNADIDAGSDPAFDLTNGTISMWVKTPDVNASTQRALFSKDGVGINDGDFYLHLRQANPNYLQLTLSDAGVENNYITTTAPTPNVWHHVAVTFGANGVHIYQDGVLQIAGSSTGGMDNAAATVNIASVRGLNRILTNDEIDDVRVYNRQLTDQEIANIYNAASGASIAAETIGYFVMVGNQPTNAEANEFDGNLGGLDGANATCLSYLNTYDWTGKSKAQSNGMLTADNVQAWLCDDTECQDMRPNSKYAFAKTEAGETNTGGAIFTTDANGFYDASDTNTWDDDSEFARNSYFWTGRDLDFSPRGTSCNNWTSNSAGVSGRNADTDRTDDNRWSNADQSCDTTDQFVCFVNPIQPLTLCNSFHAGKIIFNQDNATMQYCDGTTWQSMGKKASQIHGTKTRGGGYLTNAAEFDGTNDWLTVSGYGDTNPLLYITGSFWVNRSTTGLASNQPVIFASNVADNAYFRARFNGSNEFVIDGRDAAGSTFDTFMNSTNTVIDDGWHHVLFSIDVTDDTIHQLYIDDVDVLNSTGTTDTEFGDNIDLVNIGAEGSTGNARFHGNLADVWVQFGTHTDFSIEANRRKFIDANGYPVDLGSDGSIPTGSAPDIFLSGDTANWHTNKGTGGGFTENGALTDATTLPPADYQRKLVGWWKLDETSGTTAYDNTDAGNDGTMSGGLSANSVSAPVNRGFNFDGTDDNINLGDPASGIFDFEANQEFSMAFWMKGNTPASDIDILNKSSSVGYQFRYTTGSGWFWMVREPVAGNTNTTVSAAIDDDEWHHIVVGRSATQHFVYVDGVLDNSSADTTLEDLSQSNDFFVGSNSVPGNFFNGSLDDLRIYNYALSAAEIDELYNSSSTFYQPNAVEFDGTNDFIENPAAPIAMADGKLGTISFWFKLDDNTVDRRIFRNAQARIIAEYDASNGGQMRIWGEDSSNTTLINMGTASFNGDTTGWHHFMASWDTSDPTKRYIYLDGVANLDTVNYTTHIDGNIHYNNSYYRVGANGPADQMFDGYLADFWFDTDYIDLSNTSNQRKFLDELGNARYLGANGELVTGTAPDIFLSNPTATWHTNLGTSGGFNEIGALTDATTAPNGEKQPRYCANPSLPAGTLIFNTDEDVMQYCDGYQYIALGPTGDGGSGCSNPTGFAGSLIFNTDFNTLQYCEGDEWVGIGEDPTVSILAQGLVGHWPLDESSGNFIDVINGNNAVPNANIDYAPTSGVKNGALTTSSDNSNNRAIVGSPSIFDITEGSVSVWFKTANPDDSNDRWLLSKNAAGNNDGDFGLRVESSGGADSFVLRITDGGADTAIQSDVQMTANTWYHVVANFGTGGGMEMYVNGVRQSDTNPLTRGMDNAAADLVFANAENTSIGLYISSGDLIDDIRIYNRRLSAAEILQLYQTTGNIASTSIGLVGHWPLDETSGTTAADSSSSGNDATLQNGMDAASDSTIGIVGTAFSFDGVDDRLRAGPILNNGETEASICTWAKLSTNVINDDMRILSNSAPAGWIFQIDDTGSGINDYIVMTVDTGNPSASVSSADSFALTLYNNWTHLCGVFKGGEYVRMYADGALIGENTTSIVASVEVSGASLWIGTDGSTNRPFLGDLDDIRIYNRALSAAEITDLYNIADCPNIGDTCNDGTIYAGISADGNVKMYTTPADQTNSIAWSSVSVDNGALVDDFDSGSTNQAEAEANLNLADYPVFQTCGALNVHGHNDWFPPSRNELEVLYNNRVAIGGFGGDRYWNSTENTAANAMVFRFAAGNHANRTKSELNNLRCVRKD